MNRLPIGSIILVVVSVLIYFGVAQRILDRMRLNDKTALAVILAMFVGTYIPDIPLGRSLSINVGGAIIPVLLCLYLFFKADTAKEKVRAILSALVTGGVVFGLNRIMPGDPRSDFLDPLYIQAIVAGLVAYLAGRSRRSAFIGGVLGVIIADLINVWDMSRQGVATTTSLGGAGVFDGVVIAGILGVSLAELIGETRERLQGGPSPLGEGRHLDLKDIKTNRKEPPADQGGKSFVGLQPEETPVQPEDRKEEGRDE
ncbi:MAG: DUF1614 domain-containing protein [Bacillota bacterium]